MYRVTRSALFIGRANYTHGSIFALCRLCFALFSLFLNPERGNQFSPFGGRSLDVMTAWTESHEIKNPEIFSNPDTMNINFRPDSGQLLRIGLSSFYDLTNEKKV